MSGLNGKRMASCGVRVMGLAMLFVQLLAPPGIAAAQEVADQAAALVVFPYVVIDTANGVDTLFQLSNAGESVVAVRCFYENATHYCSNNAGTPCTDDSACSPGGVCEPRWSDNEFAIGLFPGQPVAWRASEGKVSVGIPPVPVDRGVGLLRCTVVDVETFLPVGDNVLEGSALIDEFRSTPSAAFDTARYNALGFKAVGPGNGDDLLTLGSEYQGCANALSFAHFTAGAADPLAPQREVHTRVVVVPCSVDYALSVPASVMVHYSVWSEFGQRLGTSRRVTGQDVARLSDVHATLFSAATLGTLTAKTVVAGIEGGVLVLGIETHEESDGPGTGSAAFHVENRGVRLAPDRVILPPLL
jgi:hypothetical protein